jgi:hypothetical protein
VEKSIDQIRQRRIRAFSRGNRNKFNGVKNNAMALKEDSDSQFSELKDYLVEFREDFSVFREDTRKQFTEIKTDIAGIKTDIAVFKADTRNQFAGVKKDIGEVKTELAAFKEDTGKRFNEVKEDIKELHKDGKSLRESIYLLDKEKTDQIHNVAINLQQSRADMFKGILWIGFAQILAIVGSIIAIVKFMR